MITLVLGGSGSGKSAYAEHLLDGKTNKYYIKYYIFLNLQILKLIKNIFYLINVIKN